MSQPSNETTYQSPDDIAADIERQREELARTVDQLGHKLDVKARGRRKLADLQDRATTEDGRPRPELLAAAGGAVVLVALLVWWRRR